MCFELLQVPGGRCIVAIGYFMLRTNALLNAVAPVLPCASQHEHSDNATDARTLLQACAM